MVEILAPAGNIDCLKAAVASGANAVYLGAKSFNARAKAGNFDLEQLKSAVDYCHVFDVKVYLTINTMIKQNELPAVFELIRSAALCNIDAFIVSDLGLIGLIKGATNVPVHLSTQAGVNNLEGARVAAKLGVDRVILARETNLEEIKRIKSELPELELECFVHGALCVGFSGQCLLSSSRNGDSGNRGRCRQLCRVKYASNYGKNGYLLSARDICLVNEVKALEKAGISSFKIEGRLKSPEYVASVVTAYRHALNDACTEKDKVLMQLAYNRSNGIAYLNGQNDGIIDYTIQNHRGVSLGKVCKVDKAGKFNKITIECAKNSHITPQKGDGVKLFSQFGEELGGGEIAEISGKFAVIYTSATCKTGDKASLTRSDSNFSDLLNTKSRPFSVKFYAKPGDRVILEAESQGATVKWFTDCIAETATGKPLDAVSVSKQFKKTGATEFELLNITTEIIGDVFLPVSVLNELRRGLIDRLKEKILEPFKKSVFENFAPNFELDVPKRIGQNICVVKSADQISDQLLNFFDVIVLSPNDYKEGIIDGILNCITKNLGTDLEKSIFLEIPSISEKNDIQVLYKIAQKYNTQLKGLFVNNLSGVELARMLGLPVIYGPSFNIANRLFPLKGDFVASAELNQDELSKVGGLIFAEGRLVLMRLKHCPVKANTGCSCANCAYNGTLLYNDGKYSFPIERVRVANCSFVLYNSIRTGLSGKVSPKGLFMDFYDYTKAEIIKTIESYVQNKPFDGKTAQYYKNGVK